MRHIAAFVLLVGHLYFSTQVSGLNRDKLTAPSALKLKVIGDSHRKKCSYIKCPTVEHPVCVKLKSKNRNTPKNIYIIVINKCELEYMKCHEELEAVVVPMKHCDHKHPSETPTKAGSKRVKRSPTIATGPSQDNKIATQVARKRVATKESPRVEYRSLYFGPKSRKDADDEEDAEAEEAGGSDAQRDVATESAEANLETDQNGATPEKISFPVHASYDELLPLNDGGNKEEADDDDDRKVQPPGGGVNINIELVEDSQRIDEEDEQGIEEENNGQYEGADEEENTKNIENEEADEEENTKNIENEEAKEEGNVEENDDSDNEARGLKNTEQSNGDQDPVKIKAPMVSVNFIVNKDKQDELAADQAQINNPEESQPKSAEAEEVDTEREDQVETEAAPELAADGANTSDRDETQPKTADAEEAGSEKEDQIVIKITPEGEDPQKEDPATQEEGEDIQGKAVADDGDGKNEDMDVEKPSDAAADPSNDQDQQPPGDDYVTNKPPDYEDVDLDEYKSDCPTVCPARDVMLCARCKEGVYRTFMSSCHMRMFNCKHPEEKLELVSRKPCMLSAPFLNEMPQARGRVGERRDADPVLHYLMCRTKSDSDDPNCRNVGTTDATEIK
ncbi:unnamed protein product, partial [Iphiclides podalirius]